MFGRRRRHILFSEVFRVSEQALEDHGAFNVSLVADLPLFIDPFLLFNSEKPEYQELHESIVRYLSFLRDMSLARRVNSGLLEAWYHFKEVKQTWLGFTKTGNRGSGLGMRFAAALDRNLDRLFGEQPQPITKGRHLEKLCLIEDGVGRDNISDFTTNLIKGYLLEYTQQFALQHLKPGQYRPVAVPKSVFNYTTRSWETRRYELPWYRGDFVLLVPRDILTRDENWINRTDLLKEVDTLPTSWPDSALRAQVDNYLRDRLPEKPSEREKREVAREVLRRFPELIDQYIRHKEDEGELATSVSVAKVEQAEALFQESFRALAELVASTTRFYEEPAATLDGALTRAQLVQAVVEEAGGWRHLHTAQGEPVSREDDLDILQRFLWRADTSTAGAGGAGRSGEWPVVFRLSKPRHLQTYLDRIARDHKKGLDQGKAVKAPTVVVVFCFSSDELLLAQRAASSQPSDITRVVLVDASPRQSLGDQEPATRVFISYSHDRDVWREKVNDPEYHRQRVRGLAEYLRNGGVDCVFDQQIDSPDEGWPQWMINEIEEAEFVLVVITETYNKRFRGKEAPGRGLGSRWEGAIITQEIYDNGGRNRKFIPVLFDQEDMTHIPIPLKGATWYNVSDDTSREELYFRLTKQPGYVPNPLGPVRKRASRR